MMDREEDTLEDKCENLMNIVVESRKRLGKMCIDYQHKSTLIENKLLHLQLETISNYDFKPKNLPQLPITDEGDSDTDVDKFIHEILEQQKRIENIKNKVKNTQEIVLQLGKDDLGSLARFVDGPIRGEAVLARAKNK